ncbi:MAG TPA: hypothetical protein DEF30_09900 [Proteiniclasticum sp.]|nr:hypothetical protein [Proteiniclasticum sp.]
MLRISEHMYFLNREVYNR